MRTTTTSGGRRGLLPDHPFRYAFIATLGVGVAMAVLGAVSTLSTVLVYLGIALFLALALDPLMQRATARNLPRWAAAAVLAVVALGAIVGLVFAIIPAVTTQVSVVGNQLTSFVQGLPNQAWFQWLTANVGPSIDIDGILKSTTAFFTDPSKLLGLAGGILSVGTGIIDGVTGVIVVSILTLYFVLTLPAVKAKGYTLVPRSSRARVMELAEEIFQSVGRYVGGQVVLALANAVVTFIVTSAVGSPAPALLALVAFVGALIPVVGTVFGSAIAALATLLVNPGGALIVAIVLLVYMQIEAYILSPRVMAKAVSVPGALVIVSAIGGAALGGILGALVAVPVAAAGLIIVNRVVVPRQEAH
ncbi:putative PurR-regulated permease PerM [Subtercola boreus]|nr:putative PurR-regulated permease PerM [Subtercola boreus]